MRTLRFCASVVCAPQPAARDRRTKVSSSTRYPSDDENLNVLVADDNPINRKVLSGVLRALGHTGVVVEDGQQALRCLDELRFDLVMLDVSMPVMDGWRLWPRCARTNARGVRTCRSSWSPGMTCRATASVCRNEARTGMCPSPST